MSSWNRVGQKKFSTWGAILISLCSLTNPSSARARGEAEHVVMIVWDGMRPDFITPQYTPTLYKLAKDGVFFKDHHPVYVSSTEVNGTALATGAYPDRSGIIANSEYDPSLNWLGPQGTESIDVMRRGDFLTGGHYITAPTLAETLHAAGIPTIVAGSKPVALMHDRASMSRRVTAAETNSPVLYKGLTIPRSILAAMVKANDDKVFPTNTTHPNTAVDAWTTKALTHVLWKKEIPKYTLLWLSDPDATQHETGPGSEASISALANCDKNLDEVLKALEEHKVRDRTDIFVVSDHGFSTIRRGPDVPDILKKAKFKATKKLEDAEKGDVLVVGLGGSTFLYVIDHDQAVIQRLVEFLQGSDFAGVIFSRTPIEGTFPISQVRLGPSNALPDVIVSMRWWHDKNDYGTPGMFLSDGGTKGKGSHASLSHYDMHNTLVASGPDFKKGFIDTLPSGNADVTPTILHLLGVSPTAPLDGRVLHEALVDSAVSVSTPETKTIEASRDIGVYRWKQYLKYTTIGDQIYFDEGNGAPELK